MELQAYTAPVCTSCDDFWDFMNHLSEKQPAKWPISQAKQQKKMISDVTVHDLFRSLRFRLLPSCLTVSVQLRLSYQTDTYSTIFCRNQSASDLTKNIITKRAISPFVLPSPSNKNTGAATPHNLLLTDFYQTIIVFLKTGRSSTSSAKFVQSKARKAMQTHGECVNTVQFLMFYFNYGAEDLARCPIRVRNTTDSFYCTVY